MTWALPVFATCVLLLSSSSLQDARLHGERLENGDYRMPMTEISVSRESIFEDSYRTITRMHPAQLRAKLNISFIGEDALDYGGVARYVLVLAVLGAYLTYSSTFLGFYVPPFFAPPFFLPLLSTHSEWFFLLSKEMLNPYYGLFQYSSSDAQLLEINPGSSINPDHLSYFQFIGRVLGLAVCHGHYIHGGFVMPLYKHLLGKRIGLEDMALVDEQFYNSLTWMLENDITGIIENTFTDEYDVFGVVETVELIDGGASIAVTEENKHKYVDLVVRHRLMHGIEDQVGKEGGWEKKRGVSWDRGEVFSCRSQYPARHAPVSLSLFFRSTPCAWASMKWCRSLSWTCLTSARRS